MKKMGLWLLIFLLFSVSAVQAAVFNVTNFTEFQAAFDVADSNGEDDTINVAAGQYDVGTTLYFDQAESPSGSLTIQGAGAGSTILDGGGSTPVMVVSIYDDLTIRGMTFRNGNNTDFNGGGLAVSSSGQTIVESSEFTDNETTFNGGGFFFFANGGSIVLRDNVFSGNSSHAGSGGGGAFIYDLYGNVTSIIANNLFNGNHSDVSGGGVFALSNGIAGSIKLVNNIFNANSGSPGGGASIICQAGATTITNNTFNNNSSAGYGGGVLISLVQNSANANIYNNIIRGNTGSQGDDLYIGSDGNGDGTGSPVNLFHNDFGLDTNFVTADSEDLVITDLDYYQQGSNINEDPLFVDPANGDFRLQAGSPCVDTGDNIAPQIPGTDLDGNRRIMDGDENGTIIVDMGAYEVCGVVFSDVTQGFWAEEYIKGIYCKGITTGYPDGTYKPAEDVNRAQMAAFIIRGLFGEDFSYDLTPHFSDVSSGHWAFKYIQKMFEVGISTGYGDGTYRPANIVNRAEMAVFIIRALHGDVFTYDSTPHFTDVTDTHWAFNYIQKMLEEGISTGYGDGTYGPSLAVNRASMAAFLARAFLGMP